MRGFTILYRNRTYSSDECKCLGCGGMGIVFLLPEAKDDNGNDVVVKVFRREKWKRQNDYERFRDEVFFVRRIVEQERLSGVSIPLVVPDSYYHLPKTDSARNEGKEVCQWFAMPKMEPYDFSVKRTLLDKIGLLLQVWESLSFIHSHNGAHRDIKAKNILFDRKNNRWVLSDYGLIHFDRPGGQLTKTGDHLKIYGGPRELQSFNEYKKYENRTDLFQKSDVYLFGKLCWQILANKELFFEGPFSYNSVDFKRLIEELSFSQVPFSPMMRIFQKAILDEPDDRCDLEYIREELLLQRRLLEKADRKETNCEEFIKERNAFRIDLIRCQVPYQGLVFCGEQISKVLNQYNDVMRWEIHSSGRDHRILDSRIQRSVVGNYWYLSLGPRSVRFCIGEVLVYRDDPTYLLRIKVIENRDSLMSQDPQLIWLTEGDEVVCQNCPVMQF